MTMPKTAVNEYYGLEPAHHYVGSPWKLFIMETITPAHTVQVAAHKHFGLSVVTADSSHVPAAFLGRFYVCHKNMLLISAYQLLFLREKRIEYCGEGAVAGHVAGSAEAVHGYVEGDHQREHLLVESENRA